MNLVPAKKTMSSREIATLTKKQHKHVLRDIEKILDDLKLDSKGYAQIWTHPQNRQEYKQYLLPQHELMVLLTGYSIPLRSKVLKRWEELEKESRSEKPVELNPGTPNHNGEPVCTTQQIAHYFGVKDSTINNTYRRRQSEFKEGIDFYFLTGVKLIKFKRTAGKEYNIPKIVSQLKVFTYSGVKLFKKFIYTKEARLAFHELEKSYFKKKVQGDDLAKTLNFPNLVSAVNFKNMEKWEKETSIKQVLDALESIGCDMTQPRSELNLYFGLINDIQKRLDCMFSFMPDLRNLKISSLGTNGYTTEILC